MGADERWTSDPAAKARWETIVAELGTIEAGPRETLRPRTEELGGERRSFGLSADGPRVELHETIASGGMGLLRRGRQTTLDREVAVKSVRPDRLDGKTTSKLLQEAVVAGRLEHPNIVPVHDIELIDGQPQVVMQRIEGTPWNELMDRPELVRERFGAPDLLEWNIQTLMQVAAAIHYAHDRSILHLDIKPANVMIGRFGQVYLLDWGIAVCTAPPETSAKIPLPRADLRRGIVGTPSYMAPEMVDDSASLSERTDVYLLGATLYELVAGRPPHLADTLAATLHHALFRAPPPPAERPDELWGICMSAMAPDPSDRHPTAEDFRLALGDFLRHRGSTQLADEATERLVELERILDSRRDIETSGGNEGVYTSFSAARFGFQQALTTWPDNVSAQKGLARAITCMVEWELASGDARGASNLLAELEQPAPELEARVAAALAELERREARMVALDRDYDLALGQTTRWFLTMVFGAISVAGPLLGHFNADSPAMQRHSTFIVVPAVFTLIAILLGIWARESMTKTKVNLRYGLAVLFILPAQVMLEGVAWLRGEPAQAFIPSLVFVWFVVVALLALMIEIRAVFTAIVYYVAFVIISLWPEHTFLVIAAANLAMMVNVTIMWWPGRLLRQSPPAA